MSPAVTSAGVIRTAASNAGNLERQNQERAAQGQEEARMPPSIRRILGPAPSNSGMVSKPEAR